LRPHLSLVSTGRQPFGSQVLGRADGQDKRGGADVHDA
jgi:hypothetical protein